MKLGEVLKLNKNSNIDIKDTEHYRIAGVQNYGQGIVIRRQVFGSELTMKKYQVIGKNQLTWCKVDTKNGAFGLTQDDHTGSLASSNMALADIDTEKVVPEFLEILFRQKPFADYITNLSSGSTNRKYLTPTQLFGLVELPDLNLDEQKAFIARLRKVENLSIDLRISENKALLSQLKQSILQEAIQGKLTADWRKQNPNTEPASELLKRIKAEKEQLIKDKKIRKEKALAPIKEEEIPFELPEGWVWCRLIDIGQPIIGLTYKPSDTSNAGTPVLRANNVVDGKIYMKDLVHVTFKVPANKVASAGDIIICVRSGSKRLIGKSALIDQDGLSFGAFMSLIKSSINPYLYHFLQSDCFKNQIDDEKSTGINQLTQGILKSIIIPVPPEKEQEVIIQQLQELSNKCSDLEKEITQSEKHAQILMQAILKEAFESKKEEAHA